MDIRYNQNALGAARFATGSEIQSVNLADGNGGVVFGRITNSLIEKPWYKEGHFICVGGPGMGKSSCIAIPTLARWQGSILCMDIKGELSTLTASIRRKYGEVHIFDPENREGSQYNPLKLCDTVDGAQELARTLIPASNGGDPFWVEAAQAFLAAGAFEAAKNGTSFSHMLEKLCISEPVKLVEEFQKSQYKAVKMLSSVLVGTPEKTLGGIMTEIKTKILKFAADENIEHCTTMSDWTPQTLENNATIYLKVSERMLKQYEALWTIIISQVLRYLSSREDGKQPPILILLDEFPRLGKMEYVLEALSTLRSRNVHIGLFVQSMAQLDHIYGQTARKIIADTCPFKLVFSATDPETQKYFSDIAGFKTEWAGSVSKGNGLSSAGQGFIPTLSNNNSDSMSQQSVPLIRPEEFSKLPYPLLFSPGLHPTYVGKAFYRSDPEIAPLFGIEVPKIETKEKPTKAKFCKSLVIAVLIAMILSVYPSTYLARGGMMVFASVAVREQQDGHIQGKPLTQADIEINKRIIEAAKSRDNTMEFVKNDRDAKIVLFVSYGVTTVVGTFLVLGMFALFKGLRCLVVKRKPI